MKAYLSLEDLFKKISDLAHLHSILHWDEAVMMPVGGGKARAEALTTLSTLRHQLLVTSQTADWISEAKSEELQNDWQRANLKKMERIYLESTAIPEDLLTRLTKATIHSEQAWRVMRADNNWKDFAPHFTQVLALKREKAQRLGDLFKLSPYDALLDSFSPGVSQALIDPIFAELKRFLPTFIPQVIEHQKQFPIEPLVGEFEIEKQKALGQEVMNTMGFNFDHGRLDVSHHPFCGGVSEDVRITTRYYTDSFIRALMGITHETGHALYEQHRPKEWIHQPVGHALGMMVHESQSLLMEMQACRSPEFSRYLTPLLTKYFGDQKAFTPENIYQMNIEVKAGYIRVDADEVHYPLHVILRYELEQQMIEGSLEVKDLPEAWDQGMKESFGLSTAGNYRDGVMQDVHWPAGLMGYFPAYTLGRLMSAQLFSFALKAEPHLMQSIESGDFLPLVGWLTQHVHSKGSLLDTPELLIQATGEPLNARYFIEHLQKRYG